MVKLKKKNLMTPSQLKYVYKIILCKNIMVKEMNVKTWQKIEQMLVLVLIYCLLKKSWSSAKTQQLLLLIFIYSPEKQIISMIQIWCI